MNLKRFFAVLKARNIEFFRDKSSLAWNLFFPVLLLVGFSIIFSGETKPEYKIGVYDNQQRTMSEHQIEFEQVKFIEFINYDNLGQAKLKLARHSLDILIDFNKQQYWVNEESPKSYLIEQIFLSQQRSFERLQSNGEAIRYVDWVLPGILAMNMMFSSLFGVGYAIVRYRKNSVLKRLKATPLSAFEFVSAQLLSRLFIVMFMSSVVYTGCNLFFDFYMLGSYFDLFIVGSLGAICLISLGLLVASRSKSEELIGGLLNLSAWPMMLLSGVWFSLEGSPQALQIFSNFMPLTHLVSGARAIITEGASLSDISFHLAVLAIMSSIFLGLGSYLFSWNTKR
jgi:ABC-type multidrug transport system permease subunit